MKIFQNSEHLGFDVITFHILILFSCFEKLDIKIDV